LFTYLVTYCLWAHVASVRQQLKSLHQCQSLDAVYRLADSGQHEQVIELLLPLFDSDKLFDISVATSDGYARSLLLIDSLLSVNSYEVITTLCLKKNRTPATFCNNSDSPGSIAIDFDKNNR